MNKQAGGIPLKKSSMACTSSKKVGEKWQSKTSSQQEKSLLAATRFLIKSKMVFTELVYLHWDTTKSHALSTLTILYQW
jgi:hypothetical protein